MKFTFKLEGVLEQRKHAERQCQRDVATAQQKLLRVQAEMDALSAVRRASAQELRTGDTSTPALAAHQRFAMATRAKAGTLRRLIAEARSELERAQGALVEAARQRKVMEKLRDREEARWSQEMRRHEQRESDETLRVTHQARL